MTVDEEALDGIRVEADGLGAALASIVETAGVPMRVEVHEPDGSTWVDILTPPPPAPEPPVPAPALPAEVPGTARVVAGFPVTLAGFTPGEEVFVATSTIRLVADAEGRVRLDDALVRSGGPVQVVVVGSVSGTLHLP